MNLIKPTHFGGKKKTRRNVAQLKLKKKRISTGGSNEGNSAFMMKPVVSSSMNSGFESMD